MHVCGFRTGRDQCVISCHVCQKDVSCWHHGITDVRRHEKSGSGAGNASLMQTSSSLISKQWMDLNPLYLLLISQVKLVSCMHELVILAHSVSSYSLWDKESWGKDGCCVCSAQTFPGNYRTIVTAISTLKGSDFEIIKGVYPIAPRQLICLTYTVHQCLVIPVFIWHFPAIGKLCNSMPYIYL